MTRVALSPAAVRLESRADGAILLTNVAPLNDHPARVTDLVLAWAARDPGRPALADRFGEPGAWRTITYGELAAQTARLGEGLLGRGLGPDRPLMLVSENRIEAALLSFAAYRAGIPFAPITPAYSGSGDHGRLISIVGALNPGLVVVDDAARHSPALRRALAPGVELLGMASGAIEALSTSPGAALSAAEAAVDGDTIAKVMFTSGSTGAPKGAINTHRMLASNAQATRQSWAFLDGESPVVVDWLPWNHAFGGNYVINSVLTTGGTLYVDDGRPLADHIRRSATNAAEVHPTIHLNAPRGLDMIARVLAADASLADSFFERLGVVFFASAGLPQRIRSDWQALIARHARREIAFCSAWGTTETGPLATALNFDAPQVNNIGVPVSGTTLKLAPVGDRYELRVKGPNVSPGYLGRPDLAGTAFDEEGYFRTGDVGRLANDADPNAGVLIEGRMAEDFKLSSGVWVNASAVRDQLLEAIGPCARDVVISGPQRDDLVALVFLDKEQAQHLAAGGLDCAELAQHPALRDHIAGALERYNGDNPGNSRRIARFHVMERQLDAAAGELTEKGTVNQSAVRRREAARIDALHVLRSAHV